MRSLLVATGLCFGLVLSGCVPRTQHRAPAAMVPPQLEIASGDTTGLRRLLEQLGDTVIEQRGALSTSADLESLLQSMNDTAFTAALLHHNLAAIDSLWQSLLQSQTDLGALLLHQKDAAMDSLWQSLRCLSAPEAVRTPR